MVLYKKNIRCHCYAATFDKAIKVYQQRKILSFHEFDADTSHELNAEVRGSSGERYQVWVQLEERNGGSLDILDYSCTCPAFDTWGGMCKHCAALCLYYADQLMIQSNTFAANRAVSAAKATSPELAHILQIYSATEKNLAQSIAPGQLHLQLSFDAYRSYYSYYRDKGINVSIKAGTERMYVVPSIPVFIHSVLHGTLYTYGKKLAVYHTPEMFDPISQEMLIYLADAVRDSFPSIDSDSSCYYSGKEYRTISLKGAQAAHLLELQNKAEGCITVGRLSYSLEAGDPPVTLSIEKAEDGGAEITVSPLKRICPEPYAFYATDDKVYRCSAAFQRWVLPILHSFNAVDLPGRTIHLAEKDFSSFCSDVLPRIRGLVNLNESGINWEPYLPKEPDFAFYLSGAEDGAVFLRAEVSYGAAAFPLEVSGTEYRCVKKETPVIHLIEQLFPVHATSTARAAVTDTDIFALLEHGISQLQELGEVYIDDSLHSLRWSAPSQPTVGIALHGDLIDIHIEAEGYSVDEINAILDAYRLKKKYYRLKNGEFLSLTEDGLSVVAALSDALDLQYDGSGNAQTEGYRAQYIQSIVSESNSSVTLQRNADFKRQIRALRDYSDSDYELPETLSATLRTYQQDGFRWLCSLADFGLGGILADDMGLGKTVQTLAFFLHLGGKNLVVCPASLLYNWQSECQRFAPTLPCHLVRGTVEQRRQILQEESGLFVTSYDQLRRDIDFFSDIRFDCCVLDEAQYIRNAGTKAAKAVKQIRASHRFALTGTPIENRLSDLWSIFDFLMPGYLYDYSSFKTRIEQRIVDGDEAATSQLSKMTVPFLLRRRKQEVLKELPDKVENVVYVEMAAEQQKLYRAQEQALRLSLLNTKESDYLHQKIEFLAALTRLRQLCCTPELYLENYSGGSGKVSACMELLQESAASGHRTLVFSQFTGMLEVLIAEAEKLGLSYQYLSGKNTGEQRRDMVEAFQSGIYPIFFISLKAGGTGLNLTAADRVIHFDPWWNFAVEQQATDRAHRIGQKNTVFVTKLVCKDTVEERIIALQQQKRELSDKIISNDGITSSFLDRNALLSLLTDR